MEADYYTVTQEFTILLVNIVAGGHQNLLYNRGESTSEILLLAVPVLAITCILLLYYILINSKRNKKRYELLQSETESNTACCETLTQEKEWLLREIHHRIKNNLQIVMSLLNSQSAYLTDDAAIDALKISQQRVSAISLIHKRLYTNDNISGIRLRDYITEMTETLRDCYRLGSKVRFTTEIEDLDLDVEPAVPLGLILNEALNNALRHAFPAGEGLISIVAHSTADEKLYIEVSDNGRGLPEGADWKVTQTLGMRLIRGLAAELGGEISLTSGGQGTSIKIEFPYKFELKYTTAAL